MWLDIDSSLQTIDSKWLTVLVTRLWLDHVMTLARLEKILDDSDSKGLWLWLDKNDSDASLIISK